MLFKLVKGLALFCLVGATIFAAYASAISNNKLVNGGLVAASAIVFADYAYGMYQDKTARDAAAKLQAEKTIVAIEGRTVEVV